VFIVVFVDYFVMTQSGNFWIHPRTYVFALLRHLTNNQNFFDNPHPHNLHSTPGAHTVSSSGIVIMLICS